MPFIRLPSRYINTDTITHIDVEDDGQGKVTSVDIYFVSGHQATSPGVATSVDQVHPYSLRLTGEEAQALVLALDPSRKDRSKSREWGLV